MSDIYVLGISAFYHNSAAALIKNGKIIYAAEEERFTRIKGDNSFPSNSICFCMDSAGILSDDLSLVVYYENPVEKFERLLTSSLICAPSGIIQFLYSMPDWISDKLWVENKIKKELGVKKDKIRFMNHHLSHACSAFYPSPFEEAAIITLDGVGEWQTASWGTGNKEKIEIKGDMKYPDSLGLLYSAFTYYLGFKINNGEYKMMGLAPYGKPLYVDTIKKNLLKIGDDGAIILNQKYFSYTRTLKTINKEFINLFGEKRRKPDEKITQFHADIAASIQSVTNEIVLKTAEYVRKQTGMKNLCMAGGVALNITASGLLRQKKIFDNIWIQPAAGDAGSSIGAALYGYYSILGHNRKVVHEDAMEDSFLGYEILPSSEEDDKILDSLGAHYEKLSRREIIKRIAVLIKEGNVVGVARGKAEFGPRALGNRTILADARDASMLQRLNLMVKFREGFRPFAPAVLKEDADKYFDVEGESKYMLFGFPVKKERCLPFIKGDTIEQTAAEARSDIPSVTHVDYTARIETVGPENEFFYDVLKEFRALTGCSVLINTSFNTKGEPIVNNAEDAYRCFMKSGIDYAVIGNRLLSKDSEAEKKNEK